MRTLSMTTVVLATLAMASMASAGDKVLVKPELISVEQVAFAQPNVPPAPGSDAEAPPPGSNGSHGDGHEVPLYHCVEYDDLDHIHPCAVPKIVKIIDPCYKPCDHRHACGCCRPCPPPRCVYVKICVPPCGCPRVKIRDGGRKVKYDYGDYAVEIESDDGVVEVDYDD